MATADSSRIRLFSLWREVWIWSAYAVEAADTNFHGSSVPLSLSIHITIIPLPLLLPIAEAISLQPQTTSLSLCYHNLPTPPKSSKATLSNTAIYSIYPEMDSEWRKYLLTAVGTVLYLQSNAPTQHSSVLNFGPTRSDDSRTVLASLKAVNLSCQIILIQLYRSE